MIRYIKTILTFYRTIKFTCSTKKILNTYLQIIEPYKVYAIIEKEQKQLESMLQRYQNKKQLVSKEEEDDVKQIYKYIKKKVKYISLPKLDKIILTLEGNKTKLARKIYLHIIRIVLAKCQQFPIEHLVNFIYKLCKNNHREVQLMKAVENVLIQEKIKFDYTYIRKILWCYTHTNLGSTVLYAHITKTIKIGQHELEPLQLAESAYLLSKVTQNAKGGYGVFQIAQKSVQVNLPRMSFGELVKISSYLLIQNLGSNQFQLHLQRYIYERYPNQDKLNINDLVLLLKSTSGYYFKYKQNALLYKLQTSTIRLTQYATIQQFQDLLWSWGRMRKGDSSLWHCLQQQCMKHITLLKPRQLAFFYYSLCNCHKYISSKTMHSLQQRFLKLDLQNINEHYLIKMLMGMQTKQTYTTNVFQHIICILTTKISYLNNNKFISLLRIINDSDLDYQNKENFKLLSSALQSKTQQFINKLYILSITQIVQLVYCFTKLQIQQNQLIKRCLLQLDQVKDIPKSVFIKSMFNFIMADQYLKVIQMLTIIEQLMTYGSIPYFFPPYELPLLSYSVLHLHLNVRGFHYEVPQDLINQLISASKQINPEILNIFIKKCHKETINMIKIYENIQ